MDDVVLGAGGLTQAAVDNRIIAGTLPQARAGNTARWAKSKLPTDTSYRTDAQVNALADGRVAALVAAAARVANATTRWALSKLPTSLLTDASISGSVLTLTRNGDADIDLRLPSGAAGAVVAPTITSFTVSPAAETEAQRSTRGENPMVTLAWVIANNPTLITIGGVTLTHPIASDSVMVPAPIADMSWTLTASNSAGRASATASYDYTPSVTQLASVSGLATARGATGQFWLDARRLSGNSFTYSGRNYSIGWVAGTPGGTTVELDINNVDEPSHLAGLRIAVTINGNTTNITLTSMNVNALGRVVIPAGGISDGDTVSVVVNPPVG